jgi:hypothetical protein
MTALVIRSNPKEIIMKGSPKCDERYDEKMFVCLRDSASLTLVETEETNHLTDKTLADDIMNSRK